MGTEASWHQPCDLMFNCHSLISRYWHYSVYILHIIMLLDLICSYTVISFVKQGKVIHMSIILLFHMLILGFRFQKGINQFFWFRILNFGFQKFLDLGNSYQGIESRGARPVDAKLREDEEAVRLGRCRTSHLWHLRAAMHGRDLPLTVLPSRVSASRDGEAAHSASRDPTSLFFEGYVQQTEVRC